MMCTVLRLLPGTSAGLQQTSVSQTSTAEWTMCQGAQYHTIPTPASPAFETLPNLPPPHNPTLTCHQSVAHGHEAKDSIYFIKNLS